MSSDKEPSIRLEGRTLYIGGTKIDLAVVYAMVVDAPRVLWQFKRVKGEITAIPYSEDHVIWVDKHPEVKE